MNYLNRIENWYEPTDLLRKEDDFVCEMTREDHGFLCGAIKSIRPKKILEVGVAEGGTTAVIVKSLEMLGLNCDMFSVDVNQQLYCDNNVETGYIYKEKSENVNHTFLFGKTVAGRLEQIGGDIDLVILDTAHSVPGEILDFLSILPFLSKNSMVVLHDVNLNLNLAYEKDSPFFYGCIWTIATKEVYTAAVAEKYYNYDDNHLYNIAALRVNEDTYKYIMDMFVSLSHIWCSQLDEQWIQEYRDLFIRYYPPQCIEIFDLCVKYQYDPVYRNNITGIINKLDILDLNKIDTNYHFPYEDIPYGCKLVLYGAGHVGRSISAMLKMSDYAEVVSLTDTNYKRVRETGVYEVENPFDILEKEFDLILVAVASMDLFNEIRQYILENNLNKGRKIIGPIKTK